MNKKYYWIICLFLLGTGLNASQNSLLETFTDEEDEELAQIEEITQLCEQFQRSASTKLASKQNLTFTELHAEKRAATASVRLQERTPHILSHTPTVRSKKLFEAREQEEKQKRLSSGYKSMEEDDIQTTGSKRKKRVEDSTTPQQKKSFRLPSVSEEQSNHEMDETL